MAREVVSPSPYKAGLDVALECDFASLPQADYLVLCSALATSPSPYKAGLDVPASARLPVVTEGVAVADAVPAQCRLRMDGLGTVPCGAPARSRVGLRFG
jgi:hypothetical protein